MKVPSNEVRETPALCRDRLLLHLGRAAAALAANLEGGDATHTRSANDYANNDLGTLEHTLDFMVLAEIEGHSRFVPEDARRGVDRLLGAFHVALPFEEAERIWLLNSHENVVEVQDRVLDSLAAEEVGRDSDAATVERVIDMIRNREGTIVSAGYAKSVSGNGLFDRWSAWRIGLAPFDVVDGPAVARNRLGEIVKFCDVRK